MAGIDNEILYRFTGDSKKLTEEIRKLQKALHEVPEEETTVLRAETKKALAEIAKYEAALKGLEDDDVETTVKLNLKRLYADVARARAALTPLLTDKEISVKVADIDIKKGKLEAKLAGLEARVEQMRQLDPQLTVDVKLEQANARLDQLDERLTRLNKAKVTPKVTADITRVQADILVVETDIAALEKLNPQVTVDAKIAAAMAEIAAARAALEALDGKRAELKIEIDRNAARQLGRAAGAVNTLITDVTRAGAAAQRAATPVLGLGNAFGAASTVLRRFGPLLTGITILLTSALIPGIIAVGAAFAGAVAGVGALAVALGGILAPALVGVIGIFSRVTAVLGVFTQRQQALKQAQKDQSNEAARQVAAETTLRNARRANGDAIRAVTQAEKGLQQARRDAAQNIVAAEEDLTAARQRQAQASSQLARAEVDAYREIRDAIEAAKDAVLDYQQAKLDSEQAKLDFAQSKIDLKKLRDELGATGDEFGSLFKKFENVNVDVSGLTGAIQKASDASGKGPLSPEDQNRLAQAILNVRKSHLQVKKSVDEVGDSQRDLNDKTKEADRLRKSGIAGVDSYRSALENMSGANKDAADAQKKYNDLVRLGVEGAPGVVSAHEQLADAIRNEKRQAQDLADTKKKLAGEESAAEKAMDDYRRNRKKLSDEEQNFLDAIILFTKRWKSLWKGAAGPVIQAMADIVNALAGALPSIKKPMQDLMDTWAAVISAFGKDIKTPKNLINLAELFDTLKSASKTLGGIFSNTFNTLSNIATAAAPLLQGLLDDILKMTAGWEKSTGDIGKMRSTLTPMVAAFKLFVGIVGEAGGAILNVFTAGAKPINDFLKWVKDGIKGFKDWAASAKGQDAIKSFFEDTLPLVKSLIGFVIRVGKAFLLGFQVFSPVLKPVVDMLNGLLDIFNFLLKLLLKIPTPIRTIVGWFLSLIVPLGPLGKLLSKVAEWIGKFPSLFKAFASVGERVLNSFLGPIRGFFGGLKTLFEAFPVRRAFHRFWEAIKTVVKTVVRVLSAPYRRAWEAIKTAFKAGTSAVGRILGGLADILKSVIGRLGNFVKPFVDVFKQIVKGIKGAFRGIASFVRGIFDRVVRGIKGFINVLIDGINILVKGINKIHFKVPDWVPGVGGKGFKVDIPEIPKIPLAKGGLVTDQVVALVGEAGREAVLPLNSAVYKELAAGIVAAMKGVVTAPAGMGKVTNTGTINRYHTQVEKIEVKPPAGGAMDPVAAAVKMARVLERRGGGSRN